MERKLKAVKARPSEILVQVIFVSDNAPRPAGSRLRSVFTRVVQKDETTPLRVAGSDADGGMCAS
jgi:hypothetical protein